MVKERFIMAYSSITISSRIVVNIYKFIFMPFYIFLSSVVSVGYLIGDSPKSLLNNILSLILLLSALITIYLITRLKVVTATENGLFYDDVNIPWNRVDRMYLPYFSPLPIIIVFKKGGKKNFIISTISPFKYEMVKHWMVKKSDESE